MDLHAWPAELEQKAGSGCPHVHVHIVPRHGRAPSRLIPPEVCDRSADVTDRDLGVQIERLRAVASA